MASKAIRGITVEIGGDTTKLGKALSESEKKSRSLQTELREIQKALNFDPTNVELLAQKQEVLSRNIEATSETLDTLREAEAQVIAQFERGEVSEEQVRALRREIMNTERQLNSMTSELNDTVQAMQNLADGTHDAERNTKEYQERLDEANQELAEFGENASNTFNTIATGVGALGAGAVAVAGYAVKLTDEFDQAFNLMQAQTGATAEEMAELEESITNIYKSNFGESMEDVAKSMATVKTQTDLTGKELEDVTTYALLMRDTFDFEVNESIRAVNSLMDQFGITAEEAYTLIAQGAQQGLNQNGDLMDIINEYSVQFMTAGYSAENMFNMLKNGVDEGTWSVDKLGDAMKEFNIRASDGTVGEALKENAKILGLTKKEAEALSEEIKWGNTEAYDTLLAKLRDVDDYTEQYTLGVAMFGTMWEDMGEFAISALFDTQGEISKTSDALETLNEIRYDDIGSALGGLKRTLETDVIKPLGEELKPVVEDVIEYVQDNGPAIKDTLTNIVDTIGDMISWIVKNKDEVIATIVGIGAGLLAWNVVTMIQGVVSAIKAFKIANEGATIAQWALNTAMKANPIGLIITAITALVAGFIYLWNTSDKFRAFWIGLWEKIKTAFKAFVDWIGPKIEDIKNFFSDLWVKIQEIWARISESLQPLFDSVIGAFQEGWELIKVIWDYVAPYFQGIWEFIKGVFVVVKDVLGMHFANAWEYIKFIWSVAVSYFSTIWENIKLVFSVVKTYFSGMFSTAWTAIKVVWDNVSGYFIAIWDTIKGVFSVVKNVLSGNWSEAWEAIKGIVGTWFSYFGGIWDGIKKIFGSVKTWFSSTFKEAWEAIKGVFSNWGSFFSGLWDKIKTTFSKIGTNISEAISGSVKAGLNGMISAIEGIINTGINLINGAIGTINEIPGVDIDRLSKLKLPRLYRGGVLKKGQVGLLEGDGAEAVVPLEKETGWINRIAQKMNDLQSINPNMINSDLSSKMDEIISTMTRLKSTIVLDTGTLVGETINQIDEQLGNNYSLRERGI